MLGKDIAAHEATLVPIDDISSIYDLIVHSTLEDRYAMEQMPNKRAKLIVVAMLLIDAVIDIASPSDLVVSPYALKEGVLSELIDTIS